MRCTRARIALSARMDGEDVGVPDAELEDHLASCLPCRGWAQAAVDVTRQVRVAPAAQMPDLARSVVAAMEPQPRRSRSFAAARVGLVLLGMVQVLVALRLLATGRGDAVSHVTRETSMWEAALGVGFVAAAARPHLARGMSLIVAVFSVAVLGVAAADLAHGHTTAAAESYHLVAVAGLAILGAIARGGSGASPGPHGPSGTGAGWAAAW